MACVIVLHNLDDSGRRFSTSPDVLEGFIDVALRSGYRFFTLSQYLAEVGRRNSKALALTFDDAYLDLKDQALPITRLHQVPATVFPITGYVGLDNRWNHKTSRRLLHCGWNDLANCLASGWEVGGHTHLHFNMLALTEDECEEEIAVSNELIHCNLGVWPEVFAYPYGAFDNRVVKIVERQYRAAAATEKGTPEAVGYPMAIQRLWPAILPAELGRLIRDGGTRGR